MTEGTILHLDCVLLEYLQQLVSDNKRFQC